jgi:hypothetical protein
MRILNGIIGRRNKQSFFSIDCAAVKEEGWAEQSLEVLKQHGGHLVFQPGLQRNRFIWEELQFAA